ncbi:MAG: hypothetical protein ACPMAG_03125 [Limisphaerales bacterium]
MGTGKKKMELHSIIRFAIIAGLIYSVGLNNILPGQTTKEGFLPEPVVDKSGKGKTPRGWKQEAGEPGYAGGPGTVEPGMIKEVEAGYTTVFRTIRTGVREPVRAGVGEGEAGIGLGLRPYFSLPLVEWRIRPEDADIKIGDFYLDFKSLSGTVLWSDNIWRDNTRRESDAIGIITLGLVGMLQLGDNFQLSLGGRIGYLPFQGKIGYGDPLEILSGNFTPLAMARLVYDIPVGGTDIQVFNNFTIRSGGFIKGEAFDLFDTNTDEIDRAGRYQYRTPLDPDSRTLSRYDQFGSVYYQNRVGATVSRLVPTETRLTAGGYHQNNWYAGDVKEIKDSRQDVIFIAAKNEHENMRFKPFADYRVISTSRHRDWDQIAYIGLEGPVTKQIDFLGEFGYFDSGDSPVTTHLWTVSVRHRIGPFTWHSLEWARRLTYPERYLRTGIFYRLNQTLTEDIDAEFVFDRSRYNDLDDNIRDQVEWRTGLRLTYNMSPKLLSRVGGYYRLIEYDNPIHKDVEIYTARVELRINHTKTFYSRLMYQYERRRSWINYDENLIMITLTKDL